MIYKPSLDELQNYLKIHRASELSEQQYASEILDEKIVFDSRNPEHLNAKGSFAEYLRKKFALPQDSVISLSNLNLMGLNFFKADLSDLDLSGAIFSDCSFSNTTLQNTKLENAQFCGCNFTSDLIGMPLSGKITIDPECIISVNDESLQQKLEAIQNPSTQERSVF